MARLSPLLQISYRQQMPAQRWQTFVARTQHSMPQRTARLQETTTNLRRIA
jgi:hypothetical protein